MLSKLRILLLLTAVCCIGCSTDDGSETLRNEINPADLLASMRQVTFAIPSDGAEFVTFSPSDFYVSAGQSGYTDMETPNFTSISPDPIVFGSGAFVRSSLDLMAVDGSLEETVDFEYVYIDYVIPFVWEYFQENIGDPLYQGALIVYAFESNDYGVEDVYSETTSLNELGRFLELIVLADGYTYGSLYGGAEFGGRSYFTQLQGESSRFGLDLIASEGETFFYNWTSNYQVEREDGTYRLTLAQ